MGKLLRVMTVFVFMLAIGALILGVLLFNRRELLIGRTKKLEDAFIRMAAFIEDKAAEAKESQFPERDVADCTAEVVAQPQLAAFWSSYKSHLEEQNLAPVELGPRRNELMEYYLRDPATLAKVKDEYGRPKTDGKGTMQAILDETIDKAQAQLARLNETRLQLRTLREEMVTVIDELNTRKTRLRGALAEISRLNGNISDLEGKIADLQNQIATLESQKRDLQDQIDQQKIEIGDLKEKLKDKEEEAKHWRQKYDDCAKLQPETDKGGPIPTIRPPAGVKGKVVAVNPQWNFVVIEANEQFMSELSVIKEDMVRRGQKVGSAPIMDLMVRRAGPGGEFVTKIRLMQMKDNQNLGVCDILPEWKQRDIKVGDVVFN